MEKPLSGEMDGLLCTVSACGNLPIYQPAVVRPNRALAPAETALAAPDTPEPEATRLRE